MSDKNAPKQNEQRRGPHQGGGPAGALVRPAEKAKDFKKTIRQLSGYLAPETHKFIIVGVLAIISSVFSIFGPKIMGNATTKLADGIIAKYRHIAEVQYAVENNLPPSVKEEIVNRAVPMVDFDYIARILLIMLGMYALSALCSFVMGYVMSDVAQKTVYSLRNDVKRKLDRLPLKYYDTHTNGEIMSRVTNDMDTIAATLQQSLTQLITSVVTIVGILIMMFSISFTMTVIALVTLPVSVFLTMKIAQQSQKFFKSQQRYLGNINGHVEEMLSGHRIVKAFNRESISVNMFKEINEDLYEAGWKAQFVSSLVMPSMGFVNNVGYVVVCVVGGYLVASGKLKIGDIQSFIQYTKNFTQPIVQTANITNIIQSTVAAAERVFELLEEGEEVPESSEPKTIDDVRGHVVFDNVRFGYSPENILIENMDIDIKSGQTVAIVGPTGAGKTTVVNLLLRFYELNGGSISIDGVNIAEMRRSDLHSIFGMVLQDTWLFSGTIGENIAYAKKDATEEEIKRAAKAAYADRFIRTLPHGFDTPLTEDANNISQGQKQLLTIARAILANPQLLILDEATSSVDTRTELLIQKAMGRLKEGRTSFVIAHRLSTIKNADLILVMKKGSIVEKGTHEELLEAKGVYAGLYWAQFG